MHRIIQVYFDFNKNLCKNLPITTFKLVKRPPSEKLPKWSYSDINDPKTLDENISMSLNWEEIAGYFETFRGT